MGDRKRAQRAVAAGVPATLLLAFANPLPAMAMRQPDYPSWDEVEQARANEAAAAAKIEEIEGILIRLEAEAAELNRAALELGEDYAIAQTELDAASAKLDKLKDQADAAQQRAGESEQLVAVIVAQMARGGGGDVTLGLLLGVQVPGFIDDYAKRVDAHRLEAAQNIQGFQQTAGQFFNGSLEELVRHYRSNSDPVFQRDGENLDRLMRRARMLDAEWQAMQGPWYARAWHMLRAPNHELLMETYASYSYQVLLKPEVIAWGLGCALLVAWIAELIVYSLASLFGFGEDRRTRERHWS